MNPRWTEEAEDLLRKLWDEDRLTASACAKALGVSRNAVIGKAHRMNLSARGSPVHRRLSAEARARRRKESQQRYRDKHPRPPTIRQSNLPRNVGNARVKPRRAQSQKPMRDANDATLIASWLEQNGGARKFDRAATGDPTLMAIWLRERGYQVTLSIARSVKVVTPTGRRKLLSLREFTELVDAVRLKEGLSPVLLEEAA